MKRVCGSKCYALAGAVLAALLAMACGREKTEMTVQELRSRIEARDDINVVDVRREPGFRSGYVPGSICVPLEQIEARIAEIRAMSGDVAVICGREIRSREAVEQLRDKGIPAILVKGGIQEWTAAGYGLEGAGESKGGE